MRWQLLAKIIAVVVAAVLATLFFLYLKSDAERADRVTGANGTPPAAETTLDVTVDPPTPTEVPTPADSPTATPTLTLSPLPSSTPFAAPEAHVGSAKLGKYRSMFGGKLRIQIPKSWCQTGEDPDVEVFFVDKGSCKAKNADKPIIVFSDLTTTSSSDLFKEWAETSCGEGRGGILEGPIEITLGGEPAEFYRTQCSNGDFKYAWLILSRDKLVYAEDVGSEAKLQLIEAVLAGIRWR